MNYQFTGRTKEVVVDKIEVTVHQIQAVIDIPQQNVKAGEIGGWIEKEFNLSQSDAPWIDKDSIVTGESRVIAFARLENSIIHGRNLIAGRTRVVNSEFKGKGSDISGKSLLKNVKVSGALIVVKTCLLENVVVNGTCRVVSTGSKLLNSTFEGSVELWTKNTYIENSTLHNTRLFKGKHHIKNSNLSSKSWKKIHDDVTFSDVEIISGRLDISDGAKSIWNHVKIDLRLIEIVTPTDFHSVSIKGNQFHTENKLNKGIRFNGKYYPEKVGDDKYGIQFDVFLNYLDSVSIEGDVDVSGEWIMRDTTIKGIVVLSSDAHYPSDLIHCHIEECVQIHIPSNMIGKRALIHDATFAGDTVLNNVRKIETFNPCPR